MRWTDMWTFPRSQDHSVTLCQRVIENLYIYIYYVYIHCLTWSCTTSWSSFEFCGHMWIASYPLVIWCNLLHSYWTWPKRWFSMIVHRFLYVYQRVMVFVFAALDGRASTFFRYSKAMRSWWPSMVPLLQTYDIWQYLWKVCNCAKLCWMGQKHSIAFQI